MTDPIWKLPKTKRKIDWEAPDPYYTTLHTLFMRSLNPENKKKLSEACSQTIDFLRKQLGLKKWESYFVVKTLYEEFPMQELIDEEKKQP